MWQNYIKIQKYKENKPETQAKYYIYKKRGAITLLLVWYLPHDL
jgi:hypothetical protein